MEKIAIRFTEKTRVCFSNVPRDGARLTAGHEAKVWLERGPADTAKSVTLLGSSTPLKAKNSKTGLSIELPDLPEDLRQQPAWVLKISQ